MISYSERTLGPEEQQAVTGTFANSEDYNIIIAAHQVKIPASIKLSEAEQVLLEDLRQRLQAHR